MLHIGEETSEEHILGLLAWGSSRKESRIVFVIRITGITKPQQITAFGHNFGNQSSRSWPHLWFYRCKLLWEDAVSIEWNLTVLNIWWCRSRRVNAKN